MSTSQEEATSASTASFVSAIVLNAAIFGAEIAAFTLLRPRFKSIYEPRTFLTPPHKRSAPLARRFWEWPYTLLVADYRVILHQNGVDAYMFVRFLRMMVKILLPIWLVSWAVLLPVTSVNTGVPDRTGLDRFTFGNVPPQHQKRYAAHIILVWLFTLYIFYVLHYELRHFITTRQRYLISPSHANTPQANSILVTGVPAKYLDETRLAHLFSHLPGGVRTVWLNHDLKHLPAIHARRLAACNKLEAAENALLNTAAKLALKHKGGPAPDPESAVPRAKRPTHRLPIPPLPFALPFLGKKVDSIDWARDEILATTAVLASERANPAAYPPLNSAFVLFHQQIAAHLAATGLVHHAPFRMAQKYTDVAPADVVWDNLGLNPYEAAIRTAISYALTAGLIIVWAIPVAFVGLLSNVQGLCVKERWLAWLCSLPSPVIGIIQGILPPVLLAVLMMLLPVVLSLLAHFEGIPTRSGIALSLMTRYFIFLVIHGFLIVTLSSGIIAALPQLTSNPASIPSLLAQKLPSASTFFLTFVILQGLSGTAGGFLTIVPLVLYYLQLSLLGSTPRSIYNIKYTLRSVEWGTLFPTTTLLVVIALGYSIISPIINGLACTTFFLFLQLWKYLFLWQLDAPRATETGGLFFPRAVQHVFVGLYVQQICLAALFFLARDAEGKASAVPEGALVVVLVVVTAFYNYILNTSYAPLLHALPLTLADYAAGADDGAACPLDDPAADAALGAPPAPPPALAGKDKAKDKERDVEKGEMGEEGEEDGEDEVVGEKKGADDSADNGADMDGAKDKGADKGADKDKAKTKKEKRHEFKHPCAADSQRPIWIARDTLGLGAREAAALCAAGVSASVGGAGEEEGDGGLEERDGEGEGVPCVVRAWMDERGRVDVGEVRVVDEEGGEGEGEGGVKGEGEGVNGEEAEENGEKEEGKKE